MSFLKIKGLTNLFLIKTSAYILIDCGGMKKNDADNFFKELKNLKIDIKDIHYVLITHTHVDHVSFLKNLLDKNDKIKIICHENAVDNLKKGTMGVTDKIPKHPSNFYNFMMKIMTIGGQKEMLFDKVNFDENNFIIKNDSNEELIKKIGLPEGSEIICTPGHSNDSISLILKFGEKDEKVAFCGDLSSNFGFLNTLFCCHYFPVVVLNLENLFESWEKVIKSGVTKIYLAHGSEISPSYWKKEMKLFHYHSKNN